MSEISSASEDTAKIVKTIGEIAAASDEQSQGIDQINKAVSEMDRVVQRNAGSAEESASAAEEMTGQAEIMRRFVGDLVALVEGGKNGGAALAARDRKSSIIPVQRHGAAT